MARSGLGKGLGALIGTPAVAVPRDAADGGERVHQIALTSIVPSALQPRKDFGREALQELIESIRQHGIIQPLIVRQSGARFELIAGERRFRAAQEIGLTTVPVIIRTANDLEVLELSLIENLQRADLNPLEEAMGYQSLADQYRYSQDEIAKTVGKSRSHVANTLRLLKLPASIKQYIDAGKLTAGHARALIGLPEAKAEAMARDIVERGLNVRDVETLSQQHQGAGATAKKSGSPAAKNVNTVALEKRLSDALGLKVTIDHRGDAGVVHIKYRGLDQLDDVVDRLERK